MNLTTRIHNKKNNGAETARTRHDAFYAQYFEQLARHPEHGIEGRKVSIIACSPQSPVARATFLQSETLKRHGVSVRAIFSDLGSDGTLAEFGNAIAGLAAAADARDLVRWARHSCLREAHEQLILGTDMCWAGDCMRRPPGKCNSLDIFENEAPQVVRLAGHAFDAIWDLSEAVPLSRITTATVKPSAAYSIGHEGRMSAFSFLKKSERGNPASH